MAPIAIVAGVGPGTGSSVARKFATAYPVVVLARTPANYEPLVEEIKSRGGKAVGFPTDVADKKSIKETFEKIEGFAGEVGALEEGGTGGVKLAAAVYNVGGSFIRKPFLELSEDDFLSGYETNGRGAFLFSQAVLPWLLASTTQTQYPPTLIFTGATASIKGSALCASFATGKWAMRCLSQSLAREFGPKGVHVAHAIIDGVIDLERTKGFGSNEPDAKLKPEAIAESYWSLHTQQRSAMTQEIDLRPYVEKW